MGRTHESTDSTLLTDGAGEAEQTDDEATEAEGEDEAAETEQEGGEAEQESAEAEETEGEEAEPAEAEEGQEEQEGEEAGGESEEAATVLYLDIGEGLHLNLLGLEVDLGEVELDVRAVPGENRLLGNLLKQVAGLLDSLSVGLPSVSDRLRNVVRNAVDELDLGDIVRQLLREVASNLTTRLTDAIGGEESGGEGEEESADEGDGESNGEAEESTGEESESEASESESSETDEE